MRKITLALLSFSAIALAVAPSKPEPFAQARLEPKSGSKTTGTFRLLKDTEGVTIHAEIANATPGDHGFHIHEKGDCSAPDAKSAGDHYNPTNQTHGGPQSAHAHVGDMGNIAVGKDGKGKAKLTLKNVDFTKTGKWDELVGKSIIVHEKKDDMKTQPSGDSGGRIACGVIEALSHKN